MSRWVLKFLDIDRQQEEIDTLYYFLDNFFAPSQLEPIQDEDLRIMQLCDADLLSVLDKVFAKHGLVYWLDWGTLLGAVRHNGFIPWDDDTDICMPRSDYERALEILPQELGIYGIIAKEDDRYPMARIGVGYMHEKTGIWVDIFPIDEYSTNHSITECSEVLKCQIIKFRNFYQKNHDKDIDFIKTVKKNVLGGGWQQYNLIPWTGISSF